MENLIPQYVQNVITGIHNNGYEAYVVGGSVRDILMEKEPKDWDIASNARPEEIKKIFEMTVDTGIKHGTVTVIIDNNHVEVTTYRKESCYSDNRRPDSVEFISEIEQDLSRRDFTINAIAYNPILGFKDYNNGREDIKKRIIRCVGSPDNRFKEDALRMIRAVRFAAQLDFKIEKLTYEAIKNNSYLIERLAIERVREELNKILISGNVIKGINLLSDTGLLNLILPELEECKGLSQDNPHHDYNVFDHILNSIANIKPQLYLRLTMLLHDLGKPRTKTIDKKGIGHFYNHEVVSSEMAKSILERLKYDNIIKKKVGILVRWHDYRVSMDEASVRKAINKIGPDLFEDYLLVRNADIKAQSERYMDEKLEHLLHVKEIYRIIIDSKQPITQKDLNINGNDLINLGINEGKNIKFTLEYLMKKVLEDPGLNDKELLIGFAQVFKV